MKYAIAQFNTAEVLADEVAKMIAEGWLPLGGIAVAYLGRNHNRVVYCQATTWTEPQSIE